MFCLVEKNKIRIVHHILLILTKLLFCYYNVNQHFPIVNIFVFKSHLASACQAAAGCEFVTMRIYTTFEH